jgi:hypothetical protein
MCEKSSTEIPKKSEESQRSQKSESNNDSSKTHHPHLQNFIHEVVEATNPSLRHLASHSSLGSQLSRIPSHAASISSQPTTIKRHFRPLSTNFEEQRHPGKPTLSITRSTKQWNPETTEGRETGSLNSYPSLRQRHESMGSVANGSDAVTLFSDPRSSLISAKAAKYKEIETSQSIAKMGNSKGIKNGGLSESEGKGKEGGGSGEGEDEVVYPGPLKLFILVAGIALSVFLISLDRTIITTVSVTFHVQEINLLTFDQAIPFIENEFNSYDDVGWYGSSYLLTASAFQPLYGRIYMLFNMKWSYLTSLFMFEVGSLVCGIAPNSVTLIVGRALAGLGSAGILTGSFVVVSHTVPLNQRPVLTAVVGLM